MSDETKGVVNEKDLEWEEEQRGDRYGWKRRRLGRAAGGQELGCSLMELAPGWRSWPYHFHRGNEEAIYVIEGKGTLRLNNRKIAVKEGAYIALPRGEESAHQMHNSSGGTLRYLVISTQHEPDVVEYPDSNKLGLFYGRPPGGEGEGVARYVRTGDDLDYWDGED